MLRTLARLCDFETRHLEREKLQQEQCRRKFERCRAGQSCANRQIAAHLSIKTVDKHAELPQFSSDSDDVVRPTRLPERSQPGDVYVDCSKTRGDTQSM